MANEGAPRIISSDRFEDSIIIGFSDGNGGRYSAALLYSVLDQTEQFFEPSSLGDFDEPGMPATDGETVDAAKP